MDPSERLDATFIALADPTRRAILARLKSGDATVNELAAPFDISQPAVSKHLKILERAGLAQPRAPAVHAHVGDPERLARPQVRPAVLDGPVGQAQQLELGRGAHASLRNMVAGSAGQQLPAAGRELGGFR